MNTVESLKTAVEDGTRRKFFFIEKESMLASVRTYAVTITSIRNLVIIITLTMNHRQKDIVCLSVYY